MSWGHLTKTPSPLFDAFSLRGKTRLSPVQTELVVELCDRLGGQGELRRAWQAQPEKNPLDLIAALPQPRRESLEKLLSDAARAELRSLSLAGNLRIFFSGLLNFGIQQEQAGNLEAAAAAYAAVARDLPEAAVGSRYAVPLRSR